PRRAAQVEERVQRARQRLIGQGTVQERVADDRAAYGGGPQLVRAVRFVQVPIADVLGPAAPLAHVFTRRECDAAFVGGKELDRFVVAGVRQ
ncbi:MAG: hypothetical protein EBW11_04510, partial [Betaproteobacteria bacterium]|nr:hypothetical protein [Betaproteobacteria bacterium]